ncbi:MAG: SOS response-associated peptidase family protein [Rhizobacter sp.]|nr:SOS response-associated peptidase family protein [Bacteriovorax sp.]
MFKLQESSDSKKLDDLLGLTPSTRKRKPPFHMPADDGKVFPNYFTNVIVEENDQRLIKPMRYRVRPHGSREEVPTKFNVYNARIDSLETAKTWRPLFMRQHGIVPFVKFYEWVPGPDGKPKLITFFPEGREIMWAACLWDEWVSKDGSVHFESFAIVTDDPPQEVSIMGHDRCPVFLKDDYINEWLNPKTSNKKEIYEILKQKEDVKFQYKWAD